MIKAPTEDAELGSTRNRALWMLTGFDASVWAPVVTFGGLPQINKPGWEITEMWEGMFQAVAISTRYRFCGQGRSPREALNEAYDQMREFSKELKEHMEATSNE